MSVDQSEGEVSGSAPPRTLIKKAVLAIGMVAVIVWIVLLIRLLAPAV